ncbi:hypothetical protein HDU98_011970 [Podochytrium sp. JEL0797]|nr:hypothetical protein HDU98_011970 [Podochytrium sp. JEL0797]
MNPVFALLLLAPPLTLGQSQASLAGFPTYSTVTDHLQSIASKHPLLATFTQIGSTRSNLAIPSLTLHYNHPSNTETGAIDLRPSIVILAQIQPREVLALQTAVTLMDRLVEVATTSSLTSTQDKSALEALKGARLVFVPMVNPEGFEELRLKFPLLKDEVMKNGAPGCEDANITSSGVNLGHNWDFEWNYPILSHDDFSDPCSHSYRGPEPFSEPETQALRDLLLTTLPKSVIILHSRHTSDQSRLIVPFAFHKSSFSSISKGASGKKLQMLSDNDIDAYKVLTEGMQSLLGDQESPYAVGTSWETIGETISGSDLDWVFDTVGAFSMVVQVGTTEGTYWPEEGLIEGLVEKHISPLLQFIHLTPSLPPKTTTRTKNSSLLHRMNWIPIYLGVSLLLIVGGVLGTSWCLGYDRVWDRFATWMKRMERRVMRRRKEYVGVRGSSPGRRRGGGVEDGTRLRGRGGGSGADGAGPSGGERLSFESEDGEDGFGAMVVEDEDDEGTGFSYR